MRFAAVLVAAMMLGACATLPKKPESYICSDDRAADRMVIHSNGRFVVVLGDRDTTGRITDKKIHGGHYRATFSTYELTFEGLSRAQVQALLSGSGDFVPGTERYRIPRNGYHLTVRGCRLRREY